MNGNVCPRCGLVVDLLTNICPRCIFDFEEYRVQLMYQEKVEKSYFKSNTSMKLKNVKRNKNKRRLRGNRK